MGHPLKKLAECTLDSPIPFPRRVIVERCECMHVHFRNFRLALAGEAFQAIGRAISPAWAAIKGGLDAKGGHVVLGEESCATPPRKLSITLDKNMYKRFGTKDAEFYEDDEFIHVHVGELRWEMSVDEFKAVAGAFTAAAEALSEE